MKIHTRILFLLFIPVSLTAQSNELIDEFLVKKEADTATSFLFIAQALGVLPDEAKPADGYQWALKQSFGRLVAKKDPHKPITQGLFYLALMEVFEIRGGILYTLFPTPRYAVMEAGYRRYIPASQVYTNKKMSPGEVLSGLSAVLGETK